MATTYLNSGEVFTAASDQTIYGTSGGDETVLILPTMNPTITADGNVERFEFGGDLDDYTFEVEGTSITVYENGAELLIITGLNDTVDMTFQDGTADLELTGLNSATLGGQAVSTTDGGAAIAGATVDAGDTSDVPGEADDPSFSVSASSTSVTESDTATFTVTLDTAQGTATTVNYAINLGGGASSADVGDYTVAGVVDNTGSGILTFAAGETSKTITIPVEFDTISETGETIGITLSNAPTGFEIGTATATSTIVDSPAPTFTLTSNVTPGVATDEGNTITYTITPSGVTDQAYNFTVNTTGSTLNGVVDAASGADFSPASQTITFPAGTSQAQTFVQTVVNDGVNESLEGYSTALLNTSFEQVGDAVVGTIANSGNVGMTYTLTANVDAGQNFTGGDGNDTFVGIDSATDANDTLTTGDNLNGGGGEDTLQVTVADNDAPVFTLNSIENIDLLGSATNVVGGNGYNAGTWTGVQQINVSNSTANVVERVQNLQNNVTLGLSSVTVNAAVNALEAVFAAGKVGGTTSTLSIEASSVGSSTARPDIMVDPTTDIFTTVSVEATGSNWLGLEGGAAGDLNIMTVNVSGTGSLNLEPSTNVNFTNLSTVAASSNSGGLTLDASASTKDLSLTGGSGNDTLTGSLLTQGKLTLDAGNGNDTVTIDGNVAIANTTTLNSTDSIKGGEGTDTVAMRAGSFNQLQNDTDLSVISGFETLRTNSDLNGITANIAKFGINSLQIAAATTTAAANVNGFSSGGSVTYLSGADSTVAVNVGITGATGAGTTSDTLNLFLNSNLVANSGNQVLFGVDGINIVNVFTGDLTNTDNATSATDGTGYGLVLSNDNAVNQIVASNGSSRAMTYTGSATATALSTIDLSLNTAITNVNLDTGAYTQGVVIKSGATGSYIFGTNAADNITGGAGNDVILGDAGNDIINGGNGTNYLDGGLGTDTYTGGTGTDTYVLTNITNLNASTAVIDTITNVDFTNDKIISSGAQPGAIANYTGDVDSKATVYDAVNDTISAAVGANGAGLFTYKGDTYLFADGNANPALNAADYLVKVTGYTGSLATTSFGTTAANGATIVGTAADDTLVGTAQADTLTGNAGADTLTGNAGADIFDVSAAGDSIAATLVTLAGGNFAAADTITFGNGVDVISDFANEGAVVDDVINITNAAAIPTTGIGVAAAGMVAGTTYVFSGAYNAGTGVFTIAAAGGGADTLLIEGNGGALTTNTDMVVLQGVVDNALVAADFI